jgi:hypothetical protein
MHDAIKSRRISLWLDRKSERHIQIMAAMFFIGFLLTIAYGFKTLATWSQISQIFFGLAVLFSFIPSNWLPFIYRVRKELKVLLGVCALAPLFTGIILLLNFHVSTNKSIIIDKVVSYDVNYTDKIILVNLEDEYLNKHIEIRKFSMEQFRFDPDSAGFFIHRGCFGLKTVHNPWLIPKVVWHSRRP